MSSIEQMYQQVILDHARAPHGRGLVEVDGSTLSGESHQVNPTCGDEVTLRVEIDRPGEGGADGAAGGATIRRLSWDGQGCSISQASLSVLSDLVTGTGVEESEHLGGLFRDLMGSRGKGLDEDAEDLLGDATAFTGVSQYPARIKCALLGWAALRDALAVSGARTVVTGTSTGTASGTITDLPAGTSAGTDQQTPTLVPTSDVQENS
ncbi:Fe-S cluster assembly sulfur transfer protein SufU [Oerskovia flava]|uniref:Fe-S cluster assembly sulfur transfer protein SufU n=1 Tax=Oerskovia flava TaxID=2986422 RepID=UPI002AD358FF|nr:SUF system NifU family Fe-S cluster assembly protein [Oerskovia sp. JB1-3-2]